MKKIPYGISDFKLLKEGGYYFVDKTPFIQKIEEHDRHLMFLRPRRFGKSLLIAILEAYYDVHYKSEFNSIFSDTYILNNKTQEVSSFLVLRFDFSAIDINEVESSFQDYLNIKIESFVRKYKIEVLLENLNPITRFNKILDYVQSKRKNLYVLIDEYDNFANKLFISNRSNYKNIVTDKTAFFKQFFTTLKAGTSGNDAPIKRMFITGVTPMTLFDVTSGYNIGSNISLDPGFNDLAGFTKVELKEILNYYKISPVAETLSTCSEWYDNYKFSKDAKHSLFNTDMILYYVKHFIRTGNPPDELIDINVRSDYSKLRYLIYTDRRLNGNFEILRNLIAGNIIAIERLVSDFSAFDIAKEDNFKSLLFYMGLITIKKMEIDLELRIPNETIKRIDIDFLKESLELEDIFVLKTSELSVYLKQFALTGDLEVFKYLASEIKRNTSIRDYINNETAVKAMYLTYLSLTQYYVVKSEAEMNKGFADMFLKPLNPYVEYVGIVEIKYLKREKGKKAPAKETIKNLINKSGEQLKVYEKDELVTVFTGAGKILKKIVLIFYGWELVACEEV